MKALMLSLVLGLLLVTASLVRAEDVESIRCDGGVIEVGDSVATVLEKCGNPTIRSGEGNNDWFYQSDSGGSTKIFHMEDEQVDSMEEVGQ